MKHFSCKGNYSKPHVRKKFTTEPHKCNASIMLANENRRAFSLSIVSTILIANHESTGIEGKEVLGKDYIKLYSSVVPLNSFFIALALAKSESCQQLIKIC